MWVTSCDRVVDLKTYLIFCGTQLTALRCWIRSLPDLGSQRDTNCSAEAQTWGERTTSSDLTGQGGSLVLANATYRHWQSWTHQPLTFNVPALTVAGNARHRGVCDLRAQGKRDRAGKKYEHSRHAGRTLVLKAKNR